MVITEFRTFPHVHVYIRAVQIFTTSVLYILKLTVKPCISFPKFHIFTFTSNDD